MWQLSNRNMPYMGKSLDMITRLRGIEGGRQREKEKGGKKGGE